MAIERQMAISMRILFSLIAILTTALTVATVQARPVSFVEGKTAIVSVDGKEASALLHYTINPKVSLGLRSIWRHTLRTSINAVEMNVLAHRNNGEDHQANLYLRGGLGMGSTKRDGEDREFMPAAYVGLATDWENRRFFVSYKNKIEAISGQDGEFSQSARVGIAPYVAEFGELHTWLMLEVNHHPMDADGAFTIRPLVRFFKGTHLVEVGINNRLEGMINWIGRY